MSDEIIICEWLSEDEFRELLAALDYDGRRAGCSVFKVSVEKLARNLDRLDDILVILKKYAEDPLQALSAVEEALLLVKRVDLLPHSDGYILRSRVRIGDVLASRLTRDAYRYDKTLQGFIVKAYAILDAIEALEENGFRIYDAEGILRCNDIDVEFNASLRPYQEEAVKTWLSKKRGVIVMPTGSGKTIVAIAIMAALRCRSLVIVYTREQMQQWREKILEFTSLRAYDIGLYYGEEKRIAPITIATYHSASRHIGELASRFKLLVVDEAHHLPANTFRKIALTSLAPYRLGLSATPYREDGLHEYLFKLMGGIVYSISAEELAKQGYIASYETVIVRVPLSSEEKRIYKGLVEKLSMYPDLRSLDPSLLDPSQVKQAYQLVSRLRRFLSSTKSKIRAAVEIALQELEKGSKIIIFTEYVDVAEALAKELKAFLLTGKQNSVQRRISLEGFRRASSAILVTTTVGDEGLDIADANTGILLSPLVSKRQLIQRLGRLLRPGPGKVARLYILVAKGTFEERRAREKLASLSSLS